MKTFPGPRKLILLRHGESIGNVMTADQRTEIKIGSNEYPLTPKGAEQVQATVEWLKVAHGVPDCIYSSYYERTVQTLNLALEAFKSRVFLEKDIVIDPRLVEANRGMYYENTRVQMFCNYPKELNRKQKEGLYHYRPWGGENWPDVELRLRSFMRDLVEERENESVLLIGHGHAFLLLQRLLEGFSPDESVKRFFCKDPNAKKRVMDNASVTIYEQEDRDLCLSLENFAPWKDQKTQLQNSCLSEHQ